jgi:hypothetical protein
MEGKTSNEINSKINHNNKDETKENKFEQFKNKKNRIFFNSVTGEQMNIDDGNEADMYEVVPDMEQYAQDNITQYTDICEKDKQFFKLWNSFIKSEENVFLKFEDILINFLNMHSKYLYDNDLRENFVLHLVAVYDNRQIDDDNLNNIIDIMDELFKKYEKNK